MGSLHEIIDHLPAMVYFDIEFKYPIGSIFITYARRHTIISDIQDIMIQFDPKSVFYYSGDKLKFSMHVHCPSMRFNDYDEMKMLAKRMDININEKIYTTCIDDKVYCPNQSLRLPYSPKTDGSRRLVPLQPTSIKDMFIMTEAKSPVVRKKYNLLASPITTIPYDLPNGLRIYKYTPLGVAVTHTGHGWDCPICHTHHDSENAFIYRIGENFYLYCRRSEISINMKNL